MLYRCLITAISVAGFIFAIVNYSILSKTWIEELNWKVKETFYALLALMIMIILRVFLNLTYCNINTNAKDIVLMELIVKFSILIYILIFNIVLLKNIIKFKGYNISFCKDCLDIPFYIAVLWMVFERVNFNLEIYNIVMLIVALAILAILIKLTKYINMMHIIVEPINFHYPLMAYLAFMMFYLSAVLAGSYEKIVSSGLYIISFVIAGLSIFLLDLEFRRILKIRIL